jgi:hypothetical protein
MGSVMKKVSVTDILSYSLLVFALVGGWFGYSYINQVSTQAGSGFWWILGIILVTIAAAIIGFVLNLILHEVGHLVLGLLTGYDFVSYGVFNLTIVKENGKLVRKKYRAMGTGGGCALSPPDMKNGTYPFKLFISGGILVGFLVSAICFGLFYHFAPNADFLARAFLVIGIAGAFLAFANLIPFFDIIPSDGYFLFNLGKEKNAIMRRGFWACSRMQALVGAGTRPRDIPKELFDWVDLGNNNNIFALTTALYQHAYLLDRKEFSEARACIQVIYDNSGNAAGVYRMAFQCVLLFHELINECRQEEIGRLYDESVQKYTKTALSDVDAQQFMYAYARLVLKDTDKAKEHLDLLHKACEAPFQSGFAPGAQEMVAYIDEIADKRESESAE